MIRILLCPLRFGALTMFCIASFGCAHSPSTTEPVLAANNDTQRLIEPDPAEDSPPTPAVAVPIDSGPVKRPEQRCESLVGEQKVKRSAVLQVVAAGLGSWLQGVQIDRVLEGRKFAGWKIIVLHLENPCYAAVDLRPGDVVVAINGQGPKSLERPESAQAVFDSLKKAPAIEVAYLRDGKARQLRFEIAETTAP